MWTDEQFDELEQEEHSLTEEAIIAMLLLLGVTHDELTKELRDFYSKYGNDGVVTYQEARKWVSSKDHTKRINLLLIVLGDRFTTLLDDLTDSFDSFIPDIIAKESKFFNVELDVDDLMYIKWGADDLNWLTRLEDDVNLWLYTVTSDIKQGLLKQVDIDTILETLDKRFVSMEKVLKRLALTESTAVGSIARKQIFKELDIKKYRFYAREDERTCEHCGSLHGLIFPITAYEVGVTASPIHAHCRCWEVPIVE